MAMIMDSSTHLHHQDMDSQTLESMLVCSKPPQPDKKPRPAEQALKCPRCDSINTKFCYYNNYSLSQPRYFCKSCRRYWTKGGTLRNVPVGGGCRRNRRPSSSSKRSSQDQDLTPIPSPIPALANIPYNSNDSSHDLNLAFAKQLQRQNSGHDYSIMGAHDDQNVPHYGGLFEAMRGGFLENPFSVHDLYYAGNMGGGMGMNMGQEMGMGFHECFSGTAATTAAVKQEMWSGREVDEGRILLGFPWQELAGDHGKVKEVDSAARVSWNGMGLLNSPLM